MKQTRRASKSPIDVLDPSAQVEVQQANFQPTDPRFLDTNTNKVYPSSDGQMAGVENSVHRTQYEGYMTMQKMILAIGTDLVKDGIAKTKEREAANALEGAGAAQGRDIVARNNTVKLREWDNRARHADTLGIVGERTPEQQILAEAFAEKKKNFIATYEGDKKKAVEEWQAYYFGANYGK
tara:strand:+ start:2353 stop:2895 length:543 start_codon:yes stop_codon:yes gene_type:complete